MTRCHCMRGNSAGQSVNGRDRITTRGGRGDANAGDETSAPIEDGVGEVGVYVGSFRATNLACHSQ
jgi:hypothetical protein